MSQKSRLEALELAGLVHPRAGDVTAELFCSGDAFFLAADKVQVKYEMLRSVAVEGATIVAAAASHGYSRAEYYLVAAAFADRGMAGLVDGQRGRKGPTKVSAEIAAFLRDAPRERSGAELAREVEARFGVLLHRRTAERADADEGTVATRRSGASRLRGPEDGCSGRHPAGGGNCGPVRPRRPGRAHRPPSGRTGLCRGVAGCPAASMDSA